MTDASTVQLPTHNSPADDESGQPVAAQVPSPQETSPGATSSNVTETQRLPRVAATQEAAPKARGRTFPSAAGIWFGLLIAAGGFGAIFFTWARLLRL